MVTFLVGDDDLPKLIPGAGEVTHIDAAPDLLNKIMIAVCIRSETLKLTAPLRAPGTQDATVVTKLAGEEKCKELRRR